MKDSLTPNDQVTSDDKMKRKVELLMSDDGQKELGRIEVERCRQNRERTGLSVLEYASQPGQISPVRHKDEWIEIEMTADTGACDTVMPECMCPQISLLESVGSKQGYEYEVANGEALPNLGEKRCLLITEDSGLMKRLTFQRADVHKALLSVSKIADLGYDCVLGKGGGKLIDTITGDIIPLHRKGNLYVMRAWVRQDLGFTRPE